MSGNPEVSWSIMHPVTPEPAYMREVIAHAAQFHVDSFEICGDVHGSGGNLDGAIRFRDYPEAAGGIDAAVVERNIQRLREVVGLAHASQRPVYYWHREVMVPRIIAETIPGLLDENGEFDLLGEAYQALVRSKIREFFDHVPEMDGLVLTLTESDYSVLHNSDPRRYPPVQVVRQLLETFAAELKRRGKRFILRSFGSIAQDYEYILAGAALVAADCPLEIETKITPYDFSPFLPFNPFLRRTGRFGLSAEYDSIGEFLGAGFLPAADPARVIASVGYAREQGVDRHVIRVDRIGHPTFASPQIVNLLAFDCAIRDPDVTAAAVWKEWAASHWPACATEMAAVMQDGIEMVKKTHFITGNVIFHAFPIHSELKWIQACGILSLFTPGRPLQAHEGMWGILTDGRTPSRAELMQEKDEAVAMADQALATLHRLEDRLPKNEYAMAEANWGRARTVTRAIRVWCRAVAAYFDDMEQGRADQPALTKAIAAGRSELNALTVRRLDAAPAPGAEARPADHEYGEPEASSDSVDAAYLQPIWQHLDALAVEFEAEFRERARWQARTGVVDFIVPGGIIDDIRVQRFMHASHARLIDGRPARFAGNRVFPNGFVKMRLRRPAQGAAQVLILGSAGSPRKLKVTINGEPHTAEFDGSGQYCCALPPAAPGNAAGCSVQIQKHGAEYPAIYGVGVVAG